MIKTPYVAIPILPEEGGIFELKIPSRLLTPKGIALIVRALTTLMLKHPPEGNDS